MFGTQIITYTLAILGTLFLGLVVLQNNPRSQINRTFAFFNFTIVLWLSSLLVADTAFVIFCRSFAVKRTSTRKMFLLSLIPMLPFILGAFSGLMVSEANATPQGAEIVNFGMLYSLQTVAVVGYLLYGFSVLIRYGRKRTRQVKNQINFILTGILIALIANVFTGFIAVIAGYNALAAPVGVLSLLVSSGLITYSIIRHKLFDIRVVVARSIAYILLFATLVIVYSLFIFGLSGLFFTSTTLSGFQQIAYVLFAILLAFTFQPLKRFFDKATNRLFYRDAYDPQLLVSQLNSILVSTIDLHTLLRRSSNLLTDTLKAEFCYFEVSKTEMVGQIIVGTDHGSLSSADIAQIQDAALSLKSKIILNDYLGSSGNENKLKSILDKHNIAIFSRLHGGSHPEGQGTASLILGFKKSGNIYSNQDIRVVETIANELVIAIQNALRFEEIRSFNATLQGKVDTATDQLRVTNAKLKQIDKAKDDFISMASHQLRTPLTSIKGYLSMVLEGDVGNVTATQRKVLEEAYTSSQRMVYLIGDFLNVSRIQTGKFELERTQANLAEILTDEIDQLRAMAQGRNLKIEYTPPSHFPTAYIDQDKFRQVMMNFIDNAIYYSHANAAISVQMTKDANDIVFKVTDQGIGVPADERHRLFTKFYRATNAKKQRPDGTGIGLFMAQKVIVAHGGSVIFESKENQGSTFGFRLSLKENSK